ncbi:hypothetical protein D3C76_1004880 [compost metagenome]
MQVEQPGARTDVAVRVVDLQFLGGCEQGIGVFAGLDFPATLQQADLAPGPGQTRGSNAAPVARTDDDHVVVLLDITDGGRDPCHVQVLSGRRGNSAVACKSTGARTPGHRPLQGPATVSGATGENPGAIGAHAD